MSEMVLGHDAKVTRISDAVAAGTTDVTPSTGLDMQGFEAVQFQISFGAITASAVTSVKLQQSSASDGTGDAFADIEGTAQTVADSDDNKVFLIDLVRPTERYVRPYVDRGTQNAVIDGIVAIQYNPDTKPVTHDSTVGGSEVHVEAAEGTA